ncbi:hypothetical protein [Candidatus Rhodobacter oscarellae]|uniref:hypothetical protein n=1 Tax=Candidatus Rhodobacter oscarellae TaxID=1675527 RepID=UPI00128F9B26|nr:hypothetical protein [Candidatus Rhodobacter lobularis]
MTVPFLTWGCVVFLKHAANDLMAGESPSLPDAAFCTNVRFLGTSQKLDKSKGSFAKGLWHKIFQPFQL